MPFSKKKENKQKLIPIVTDRSVIPIRDYGNIDEKIDKALFEFELENRPIKMQGFYWFKRIFLKEEGFRGRIYCFCRFIDTFF